MRDLMTTLKGKDPNTPKKEKQLKTKDLFDQGTEGSHKTKKKSK